jgi:hypothetical protein
MAKVKPMGIKGTATPPTAKAAEAPKAPKASPEPKSKPAATGDVSTFPSHVYRLDHGESLPPQAPHPK